MTGSTTLQYLKELCDALDNGRPVRPFYSLGRAAVPATVALSLLLAGGCGPRVVYAGPPPEPLVEICDDGADNDGNGAVDCDDPACTCDGPPPSVEDGGTSQSPPPAEDSVDNNGNSATDDGDPSYTAEEFDAVRPLYGAP